MNKLINTQNGGFDFKSDDLRWMQNSFIEALKGLASPYQTSNTELVILSGCEESSTGSPNFNPIVTSGFILYNGEIYYHDSQTMPTSNPQFWYWTFQNTYDPSGLKVFKNQQSYDTYQVNRVTLIESFSPQITLQSFTSTKSIFYKIKENLAFNQKTNWINFDNQYSDPFNIIISPMLTMKYMKDIDGFVHLTGYFVSELYFPEIEINTLPVSYRPPFDIEVPYLLYNSQGTLIKTIIKILNTGKIIYSGNNPLNTNFAFEESFRINFQLIPPFRTF